MRRFHAELIDRLVFQSEHWNGWQYDPLCPFTSTCVIYDAACAFANLELAQHTDRLEDWDGLFSS